MAKVLLIGKELTTVQLVSELLRAEGHMPFSLRIECVNDEMLTQLKPELIISDFDAESLESAPGQIRRIPAILLRHGATTAEPAGTDCHLTYIGFPFTIDRLKQSIERVLESRFSHRLSNQHVEWSSSTAFDAVPGTSPQMEEVRRLVRRMATSKSPVLLTGECGTERALIASALHKNGPRRAKPYGQFKCSYSLTTLEGDLFGHGRNLHAGADVQSRGVFEKANGGVVFLDDVDELPLPLQGRISRMLNEEKEMIRRMGEAEEHEVDIRLIVGASPLLEQRVRDRAFRSDLYFALNTFEIRIPPLRERIQDIPSLVQFYLSANISGKTYTIMNEALNLLCQHHWPGNAEELRHCLVCCCERAKDDQIRIEDLPPKFLGGVTLGSSGAKPPDSDEVDTSEVIPLKAFLQRKEAEYVQRVLSICQGDKDKAARVLGISVATLYRILSNVE